MGKHSAPSQFGPTLAKAGVVALAATTLPLLAVGTAEAADTSILEVIAFCESGNRNIPTKIPGGSTASGYLQILDSTWKAFGGKEFATRALHASRQEQFVVGARVLQGQGINAWSPSKSCWGSKISTTKPKTTITPEPKKYEVAPPKETKKITPKTRVKKITTAPAPSIRTQSRAVAQSYLIKHGDTLSGIAKSQGSTIKKLAQLNRDTVKDVDLIFAGARLRLR